MWSKPLLYRFRQSGEIPQMQASQGFAAFHLAPPRIPPRHSQSKRATNCANPGFWVIQFCTRCGQTCGQAVFLTTSTCERNACIAGVSMDCGNSIFRLEGGATRSQSRRATNCATPRYEVGRSGWAYSPNVARYQLRYTRIFNLSHYITAVEKIKELFCLWSLCDQTRSRAAFGNRSRSHKTRPSQGTAQIGQGFCHEALLLYRLPSADASIICDGKTVFLRLWGGHPSWPRAPSGSHRAAFWRSTMRFPLLRPP